jgi:hypothetical protein
MEEKVYDKELTPEQIEKVKEAYKQVQVVIDSYWEQMYLIEQTLIKETGIEDIDNIFKNPNYWRRNEV